MLRPVILMLLLAASCLSATAAHRVALVSPADLTAAARFGLDQLEQALRAKGLTVDRSAVLPTQPVDFLVIAGVAASPGLTAELLKFPRPSAPESLAIRSLRFKGQPTVVLFGADPRGLMYAALDTAERISWSREPASPFARIRDVQEAPRVAERSVSIYTMHRGLFEQRLYDEQYWQRYFGLLARSRINNFIVIFGYENGGFMAPPYPYFFDTAEFPGIRLMGITAADQIRNTAAFRSLIRMAHDRGIQVSAAIWDHIYRGGVQGGGIPGASELAGKEAPGLVAGLHERNLVPYTKAALKRFLETFGELDALQFRMHGESGLKRGEMEGFWHDVFLLIKELRPSLRLDLRAKELPDSIIDDALRQGLPARVSTKYWMEQMGLPFHPTHVNPQNQKDRRHGYADLLSYPQRYKVHWQLWSGGTARILLWADPDYVRRFVESTRLYGGESFDVNEMLATWMLGSPHDAPVSPILNPNYRYFDYEFERYWHFFQIWGQVAYNPDCPSELWEQEFERRFGPAGPPVMKALHLASAVLPRVVAASYRYQLFPTTRGWAEMMRQEDLPKYAELEGSDVAQFMNPREAARSRLSGSESAMRRPEETSRYLARLADEILDCARRAQQAASRPNNELRSTLADVRILAGLAKYHAERLRAAVSYNLYRETGDLFSFDDAIAGESRAIAAWEQMVAAAGDLYSEKLELGVHNVGFSWHWKEELALLRRGLENLREQRRNAQPPAGSTGPKIAHAPARSLDSGGVVLIRATVASAAPLEEVNLQISDSGAFRKIPMRASSPGMYQTELKLPAGAAVRYFIEAMDASRQSATFPAGGKDQSILIDTASDREPPQVRIEAGPQAHPGEDFKVEVRATDPSGVKSVRLRYRHLTQYEDYGALEMKLEPAGGRYAARIPGDFVTPRWDLMFYIEAIDAHGNGRMFPDLDIAAPYVIVPVKR